MGTMTLQTQTRITAVLFLILHLGTSQPAKSNARPVHEIINEQARSDEKVRLGGSLPYGNPLAGNSQKNARLHAQNQQAMFNAERVRQHRAQIQRWNKAPQQIDSYMRAYHESQESHQLALEQQQANFRDKKTANPTVKPATKTRNPNRGETLKRGVKVIPEVIKITKGDAIKEKNRNHRSHGSVDFNHKQYLEPKAYKTVYLSAGPTYDQGVTIKPNGNVGLATETPIAEDPKLYTEAVPSKARYVYPKQYSQMQSYESAKDIEALNLLLKKTPQAQMSELNALLNSGNSENKDVLETPIDLYFYTKDPPVPSFVDHYDNSYAQIPPTYASAYMPEVKDHTPITEEVDDIENPNKDPKIKPVGLQTVLGPQIPETTTTKSNNYYKVEVASQVISSGTTGYNPELKPEEYSKPYAQPLVYYLQKGQKAEGDLSERYLHHNSHHQGIQHLSEDGIGTSAYGDDVSKANTKKRAKRTPTINEKFIPLTEKPLNNNTPVAEPLIRIIPTNPRREIETFLTTPNFPIGVATDNNNFDYEELPQQKNRYNRNKYEYAYDDGEYNDYGEDFVSPDYEYGNQNFKQPINKQRQNYAPAIGYGQNVDSTSSFSNKYGSVKRFPQFAGNFGGYSYGVGAYQPPSTSYGVPHFNQISSQHYGVPRYGVPNIPNVNNIIEPVYMLTESQLKNLIGQHTHIQHLDVFQYPYNRHSRSKPRAKKRRPYVQANTKKHLQKLHKLNILK